MNIINALYIVPILGFLILIHEFGHYVTAKRAGMRVEEFGIGLPPRIWGKQRGETLWSINAIPMGGFVRVLGEDGKNFSPESMQAKSAGQRTLFITGGVIMNFITALVLIGVLVAFQGESRDNVYVAQVMPNSPAEAAGWQPADRFISIEGEKIDSSAEVASLTRSHEGEPMQVLLERDGQQLVTTVVPRVNPPAGEGRTGILLDGSPQARVRVTGVDAGSAAEAAGLQDGDEILAVDGQPVTDYLAYDIRVRQRAGQTVSIEVLRDGQRLQLQASVPVTPPEDAEPLGEKMIQDVRFWRVPVWQIPVETVREFFSAIRHMGEGLISLLRGDTPLGDVAGPIGMGQLTSEVIRESSLPVWVTLVNITFFLSLNLAILNLLPLPALDGGRLVFVVLEVLRRGKRIAPEKEGMVHFVGLVILLTLMFVIAFLDVDRLISGNSLIE